MENLLAQYASLRNQLQILEGQEKELATKILSEFRNNKIQKQITSFGSFSLVSRTTYVYSEKIKKLEESVKIAKVKEVNSGTAKQTFVEYIKFTEVK